MMSWILLNNHMQKIELELKNSTYYKTFKYNYDELINELNQIDSNYFLANHYDEINTLVSNFINSFANLLNRIDTKNDNESIFTVNNIFSDEEIEFFNAFRYLANQIKHDLSLELITMPVINKSANYSRPYLYGDMPTIEWRNFKNKEKNKHEYRNQYDKYLKEKSIKTTIEKLYSLVNDI